MVRHHPRKDTTLSILARHLLNSSLNIEQFLPAQSCVLCGANCDTATHQSWCAACDAALPYLTTRRCHACALPTPSGEICGHCIKTPPHFQHTVAVFGYAFPLDKLIHALKYGERLELVNSFADPLAQRVNTRPNYIIPMPLHPARLRERGFNQSLELARRVGENLNIPVRLNSVQRVRDTPPQSSLSRTARNKNMRQAFAYTQDIGVQNFSTENITGENLSGQHIAIVDDVMTSGASLNEVARVLRQAGASEVSAWVVARALPR